VKKNRSIDAMIKERAEQMIAPDVNDALVQARVPAKYVLQLKASGIHIPDLIRMAVKTAATAK
jgi:hypothetical protein